MQLDAIFQERDLDRASAMLDDLERHAEIRDGFLAGLALDQLSPNERYTINHDDEEIAETLAFAHFYLIHLADLEAHAPELTMAA